MRRHHSLGGYDASSLESWFINAPGRREYVLHEIGRGKRVLDLGYLTGSLSTQIKRQNNEVHRLEGFDLDEGIPFDGSKFDVVNASDVLSSTYDTKFLLAECHRVLRPHGILIATVFNLNSFSNRIRILAGDYLVGLGAFPEDHFGGRIRVFNLKKLRELFRHTGFEVEGVRGISKGPRLLRPILKITPQWGQLLVVKARRVEAV